MSQTRIVVSSRLKPLAEELVTVTGVDSLSDLLSLLLTKYGRHLKASWELPPQQQQAVIPPQNTHLIPELTNQPPAVLIPPEKQQLVFQEEIDPAIARIAGLIDDF